MLLARVPAPVLKQGLQRTHLPLSRFSTLSNFLAKISLYYDILSFILRYMSMCLPFQAHCQKSSYCGRYGHHWKGRSGDGSQSFTCVLSYERATTLPPTESPTIQPPYNCHIYHCTTTLLSYKSTTLPLLICTNFWSLSVKVYSCLT